MKHIMGFPSCYRYLNNNRNKHTGNYYLINTAGHSDRILLNNFQAVNMPKLVTLAHAHRVENRFHIGRQRRSERE